MTEGPSNPASNRRRWLVVALLAVVVMIVGSQLLPRADARFVGRWQGRHLLDLQANGRGSLTNSIGGTSQIRWWFDGQILCLELIPADEPAAARLQSISRRLRTIFQKGFEPNGLQLIYWVDGVTPQAIEYRVCQLIRGRFSPYGQQGHQFIRLPE